MTEIPGPDHPISLDPPARICVVGGGPIGLEAALYGRFLGFHVDLFEKGEVADHVNQWGHVRLFTPFSMLSSKLGRGALEAQDPEFQLPSSEQLIDGKTWRERYLIPLAESDLLSDSVHSNCQVVSISRVGFAKQQGVGDPDRQEEPFAVLWQDRDGKEHLGYYDFVLDASGNFSTPNNLGTGGVPALGERALIEKADGKLAGRLNYGVPDFKETKIDWSKGSTLLVGDGYSAATTAIGVWERIQKAGQKTGSGEMVWLINKELPAEGPVPSYENDPLQSRVQLTADANRIALQLASQNQSDQNEVDGSRLIDHASIVSIEWNEADQKLDVQYRVGEYQFPKMKKDRNKNHYQIQVDRIVVNSGYKPDLSINRELAWHQCYASEGPMAWAAATLDSGSDCMTKGSLDATAVLTTERRFFMLGMKSFGRNSNFLYTKGLDQIRDTFCWIGGRATLDLYSEKEMSQK